MKQLLKYLISFLFIIVYQNAYSKPIPPGSGAGDVPANILFLLDTSVSMNEEISAPGTSVGQTNDIVELSDGYLIIAEAGGGIIKMSIADGVTDGSFADGAGKFHGASSDPKCDDKDSGVQSVYEQNSLSRLFELIEVFLENYPPPTLRIQRKYAVRKEVGPHAAPPSTRVKFK